MDPVLEHRWFVQVTGKCDGRFYLLVKIVLVNNRVGLIHRVIIWITINVVILVLDCSNHAFRTERPFITSGAAVVYSRRKGDRICADDVFEHLLEFCVCISTPELHDSVIIRVISKHFRAD